MKRCLKDSALCRHPHAGCCPLSNAAFCVFRGNMEKDYITLKWGTLKSWKLTSEKGKELIKKYSEIGSCYSAMMQRDTPEQKNLICEMIDNVPGEIFLDWDGKYVSKEEAKKYVTEYSR